MEIYTTACSPFTTANPWLFYSLSLCLSSNQPWWSPCNPKRGVIQASLSSSLNFLITGITTSQLRGLCCRWGSKCQRYSVRVRSFSCSSFYTGAASRSHWYDLIKKYTYFEKFTTQSSSFHSQWRVLLCKVFSAFTGTSKPPQDGL